MGAATAEEVALQPPEDLGKEEPKPVPPQPRPELDQGRFAQLEKLLSKALRFADYVSEGLSVTDTAAEDGKKVKVRGQSKLLQNGTLKQHQLIAVEWLVSLFTSSASGILADEMGLGKTISVIALVARLMQENFGPHLIVVPLSTLGNWRREFEKWLPSMPVSVYHGPDRDEVGEKLEKTWAKKKKGRQGVVLTTFQIAIMDKDWFQRQPWCMLVVDEAHRLKNFECKLIKSLRQLNTQTRVLLTGTPLQNNLTELWSILNFIMPLVFDDLSTFTAWFDMDSGGNAPTGQERHIIEKLHAILRPFMLRRRKKDVVDDLPLPRKKELALFCKMTPQQHKFYSAMTEKRFHEAVEEDLKRRGVSAGQKVLRRSIMNPMMQLIKLSNHTFLFPHLDPSESIEYEAEVEEERLGYDSDGDEFSLGTKKRTVTKEFVPSAKSNKERLAGLLAGSGKLQVLQRMLPRLRNDGHRVLLFSQSTRTLDLIQEFLALTSMPTDYRIDGTIQSDERQSLIESFKEDSDAFIFLLSTRAGGLGINLCAADTVILHDSDWNPQSDLQAMDRAHRMGQTRDVVVYRLISRGSVEEDQLERATSKLRLEDVIIERGKFQSRKASKLSEEDLLQTLNRRAAEAAVEENDDKMLDSLLDRERVFSLKTSNSEPDTSCPAAKRRRFVVLPDKDEEA